MIIPLKVARDEVGLTPRCHNLLRVVVPYSAVPNLLNSCLNLLNFLAGLHGFEVQEVVRPLLRVRLGRTFGLNWNQL